MFNGQINFSFPVLYMAWVSAVEFIIIRFYCYIFCFVYSQSSLIASKWEASPSRPVVRVIMLEFPDGNFQKILDGNFYDQTSKSCIGCPWEWRLSAQWGTIKGPLKPLNTIVLWWYEGFPERPSIGPPWCRETLVSLTAVHLIAVVFLCF